MTHRIGHAVRRRRATFTLVTPKGLDGPSTRVPVRLLGPCFKTGRLNDREKGAALREPTRTGKRSPRGETPYVPHRRETNTTPRRPTGKTHPPSREREQRATPADGRNARGRLLVASISLGQTISAHTKRRLITAEVIPLAGTTRTPPAATERNQRDGRCPGRKRATLDADHGDTATFNNACPIVLTSRRRHELLTLAEESFSTFSHGTCSLSVSWSYLVLDGVYHLIQAALSSNPTLGKPAREHSQSPRLRGYHPLWLSRRESFDT